MPDNTAVHVISRDEGWVVVREGTEQAISVHATQAEADKAGREIAREEQTAFVLHAKDGRIRDRSDYGSDRARARAKESPEAETPTVPSAATQAVGGTVGAALDVVDGTVGGLGGAARDTGRSEQTSDHGSDGATEAGGLSYENRYANYGVFDREGEGLGRLDTLFLDEDEEPEYVGVRTGSLGSRFALVPIQAAKVDDERRVIEVAADREHIESGPTFATDGEITQASEREVHAHYGLEQAPAAAGRGTYGEYHAATDQPPPASPASGAPGASTETDPLGAMGKGRAEVLSPASEDHVAEDEITVQRAEEELVAGTREVEAGELRVRKRVRTGRERMEVPVRREEVSVERVPVSNEASEVQIGEDEIAIPIMAEEVVVSKRQVVKEELRIRKEVVEEVKVVEEDVRREEIDVEDQTPRRDA